jgi:hypothetical protein
VALEFQGVDLVGLGELGDDRAHGRDVHVGAVQHDQRIALAGDLVVHLHAVDRDAAAHRLRLNQRAAGDEQNGGNQNATEHRYSSSVFRAAYADAGHRRQPTVEEPPSLLPPS